MSCLQPRVLSPALLFLVLWEGCAACMDVAFSAGSTSHLTLASGQKLVYNRVFANVGSALNITSGIFTCPQSGLYMFSMFALTSVRSTFWLELFHNSRFVQTMHANTNYAYASGGNSVILPVNKGDNLYISSRGTSRLYGNSREIYVTFNGYLLSPVLQDFV